MDTETTQTDSSQGAAATLDLVCETDCRDSGYDLSRFNACSWQTTRNDIMVCLGDRCRYRFCGHTADEMPRLGSECPWEIWYANKLLAQFDQLFPRNGVGRHMDDRQAHRKEWVLAHLLANRAGARARVAFNEAMDAVRNRGRMPVDRRPFDQHDLAMRYRTAARNRLEAVWAQVDVIEKRIRDERIRRLMIAHGHWRIGDAAPPDPDDAPAWILREVDGSSGAR